MKGSGWLWLVAAMSGLSASGCVVETDCADLDDNGICDIDEECIDDDLDTVCDDVDWNLCVDDITLEYLCDAGCTSADNFCSDPWFINYCDDATSTWYNTDCADACINDDRVYGEVCGGVPAATGECADDLGACECWCQEAFDHCNPDTEEVVYTRDGVTYSVDCKDYCNGVCDDTLGACAC